MEYLNRGKIFLGTEELAELSISVSESVNGKEHNITADCLFNLAMLYDNQGRYDEAEPLYKRALLIEEKVLGSEHPRHGDISEQSGRCSTTTRAGTTRPSRCTSGRC